MENLIKTRTRLVRLDTNDNALIKTKLSKYTKSIDNIEDLGTKDGKFVKQVTYTFYMPLAYEKIVNRLVAKRYTIEEELAIHRKAFNGITDEYRIYNAYVEECKTKAKEFVEERNKTLEE